MGVPIVIALAVIVLAAVGYLLWTLFAAGRGAAATAESVGTENTSETAPHSDEHTKIRHVETKPPQD
ncbi:hypothetical protein [Kribbella sp. CA-293567]|uniref:hypothetical protein n=1 Tax=Kribbella sp. CA-293567 TaxID=3002436 RepID=UPI0022DD71C7|nr:hypothetical protein [Kribbella sp. CA-293567]WBQ08337.1 hypothetical protein OX958_16350 [Kribbella sp. CA-293567]